MNMQADVAGLTTAEARALPAVLSVTLAVGASALARMQAIVSRLVSIEEMAGMDVLCSDKTGTLTKNEITLGDPVVIAARDKDELLLAAALACERESPDVIEGANRSAALAEYRVIGFEPFDPVRKRAEAEVGRGEERFQVAKGAPQAILGLMQADPALAAQVRGHTNELTQLAGTLGTVYGWFVEPIGWRYALFVWAYALAWFVFNCAVKVWVERLLRPGAAGHARHLRRIHASLHECQCPPASCACPPSSQGGSGVRVSEAQA